MSGDCTAQPLATEGTAPLLTKSPDADPSHSQGKSVTGHVTDKEFTRYSRAADQVLLAEQAMANLDTGLAKKGLKSLKKHDNE